MAQAINERWQVGDLTIDVGKQSVTRLGNAIAVPQLSFRFLLELIRGAPNVLSVDDLMDRVWTGVFVNGETVTQRAKLLRDALGDDPRTPRYFTARRGLGYQLVPRAIPLREPALAAPQSWGRKWRLAAGAFVMGTVSLGTLGAVAAWNRQEAAQASALRIAVLPFDNLSSDPADAYIARSIPEIVLNRLSSVRGLTVISRDSALLSPAANTDSTRAASAMQAAYVVKGSVQRTGANLRVTCFVLDTAKGSRLWSERFDWPVAKLYALQDRIAERVATSLESKVTGLPALAPVAVPTRNPDAYLAYLKGKSLLGRFTVAETDAAAVQFERAVALDPEFADALVALYDARMQAADLRRDDLAPFRARFEPMLDKALRINPASGPALFAKAMWSSLPAAERIALFKRAATLDPSNSRGLTAFAQLLDSHGNPDTGGKDGAPQNAEAKAILDRVLAIDPLSPRARFWAIQRHWKENGPDWLKRSMARELELDPQNYILANRYAFRRWLNDGQTADAIELMERVIASDPQQPLGANMAVAFYLDASDPAAARQVAQSTSATRQSGPMLLSQYDGDLRGAGDAALGRGGYLFNVYQSWNWPQAVRDYGLATRQYDRAAQAIAIRFAFDLSDPQTNDTAQANAATALAHLLQAKGERAKADRLLAGTVRWIDGHPSYGLSVHMRIRATAMMLLGQRDEALSNLRVSVETGRDIRHWWYVVDRDPVWAPVRNDPRFRQISELYRSAAREQRARLELLRSQGKVPKRTPAESA